MAVTATSTLVELLTTDPARPPGHNGWNNPYGDPHYIEDVDWYRRVQLVATGSAGEVSTTVNWEVLDPVIPVRTTAQINALADGTVGALINNTTTWTIWAYTGVNVAGQAYKDTGTPPVCFLRANGPRVQVLLGPAKAIGGPSVTYTIGAFAPGAGKVPSAQTTQVVNPRATFDQPTSVTVSGTATITSPATTTVLTATVVPAGAAQVVTWTSSDPTKATVASTTATTGTVTAVGGASGNGTTVIKAVALGNSSIQSTGTTVTVSGFTLREGEEENSEQQQSGVEEEEDKVEVYEEKKSSKKGKK